MRGTYPNRDDWDLLLGPRLTREQSPELDRFYKQAQAVHFIPCKLQVGQEKQLRDSLLAKGVLSNETIYDLTTSCAPLSEKHDLWPEHLVLYLSLLRLSHPTPCCVGVERMPQIGDAQEYRFWACYRPLNFWQEWIWRARALWWKLERLLSRRKSCGIHSGSQYD